jgi:2,4-dienoyl-CoA reductase-like NADH-dependent reductase (Old Yellow Enzyme family)/thioredoxin reductase
VHESGLLTDHTIDASSDAIVDAYEPFAAEMREEGARVFAQLFHGGRERYDGEYAPPAPSSSDTPTDRLHVVPRPMETDEVHGMIEAYADAAARMEAAGLDGVEIVGSHGYLPAQFWSHRVNDRTDEFGGSLTDRCRFTTEILDRIRDRTGDDFAVGVRLSAEERHDRGLSFDETLPIIEHVDGTSDLDYWSVVVGSSSTQRSCSYIVPPATEDADIVRSPSARIRKAVTAPVIATSRINTPDKAEETLRSGAADVVGMTRALIADPTLPRKTRSGNVSDVTPCVACNQGCIGRYQEGLPIRCTVNPVTGRESAYGDLDAAPDPKSILVVGGGPAGLVAASTAAGRGHDVTLLERDGELGGQVRRYADLPHRGRYDAWLDVLEERLRDRGVDVRLNTEFESGEVDAYDPDELVLAVGATGRTPDIPIAADADTLTADEALARPERLEGDVIVSDWDGNWAALDVALQCVERGCDVEVVTAAYSPGESIQQYIQNVLLGDLYEAGVEFTPHHRVASVENHAVVVENVLNERRSTRSDPDAVVFAHGGKAPYEPFEQLRDAALPVHRVGDAAAPRSLDEAVWEAFDVAAEL